MSYLLITVLGEDPDALSGRSVAHGTLGLLRLTDLPGAVHAEEVVPAWDQRSRHFALAAHVTVSRHHSRQAARFQATQHGRSDADSAAAAFRVSWRATRERRRRAGRVAGGASAAAAAAPAGERAAATARLQPGEGAEGVALSTAGQWVIRVRR